MVIDMTQLFSFYKRFTYAQNGGSYGFFSLLNDYMSAIVEEVYINHGDVLKFSRTFSNFISRKRNYIQNFIYTYIK